MSKSENLHDSSDLIMEAVITDEGPVAKVEAELVDRASRKDELSSQVESSRVAHAVTRDSFRGFGINE
jgi:hypothetical protein